MVLGGDIEGGVFLEQFRVDGVACQLVHQTVDAWRETAAVVLDRHDTTSPVQKALSGLHAGIVLHGGDVIEELRADATYPAALRVAMVEANLDVFPLWRLADGLATRGAELWQRSELVAGLLKVLGMLAGVNEVYFSTFQLKHARELETALWLRPAALVDRVEAALVAPMVDAALALEQLVDETLAIVGAELPEVEVSALRRHVGARAAPWDLPPERSVSST
jgi:hypothetical protein